MIPNASFLPYSIFPSYLHFGSGSDINAKQDSFKGKVILTLSEGALLIEAILAVAFGCRALEQFGNHKVF